VELARAVQDPRIRVIADGEHVGLVGRLNQIAREASGSLLARMDADDLMHPARIREQVAFLSENPEIPLVSTWAYGTTPRGIVSVRGPHRQTARTLLRRNRIVHPTVTMRREFALDHPYDDNYPRAEDLELWARCALTHHYGVIEHPLFFYNESSSVSMHKYLRGAMTQDLICRRYGPAICGRFDTLVLRLLNAGKTCVALTLIFMHQGSWLIRWRGSALSSAQEEDARGALEAIRNAHVPLRSTHSWPSAIP